MGPVITPGQEVGGPQLRGPVFQGPVISVKESGPVIPTNVVGPVIGDAKERGPILDDGFDF